MRLLCLALAGLSFVPTAFAQEAASESAAETTPATTAPEATAPVTDASSMTSEANKAGGLLLPFGKVGPSIGLIVPHVYDIGLQARLWDTLSVGFSYSPKMELDISSSSISMTAWNVNAAWIPFQGSFLVGARLGQQTIEATANEKISVTGFGERQLKAEASIDSMFVSPHIGWQWVTDIGLFFGTELGVQLPMNVETKFDGEVAGSAAENAAAKETADYKKTKKDVEDGAKLIGETPLPYLTVFKIGWFF